MLSPNKFEIKDFSFSYGHFGGKSFSVLRDINFKLTEGEFVSIVGPSGCGKSTLLYCILGLLKYNKGEILLDGKLILRPSQNCSMVFQSHSLLPWRDTIDNILYGLQIQGKRALFNRAKRLVNLVGLSGFEKFYPHQLSGGMQQRVNLARALATDPEVLLMDEPFASLDAQTRELMQAELLKIWQKSKKTVLFVTHQINEAIFLSDRVIVLSRRPATIKQVIDVNLPRPRSLEIKLSDKFIKTEKQIWKLIMEEVGRAKDGKQKK